MSHRISEYNSAIFHNDVKKKSCRCRLIRGLHGLNKYYLLIVVAAKDKTLYQTTLIQHCQVMYLKKMKAGKIKGTSKNASPLHRLYASA